MNRLRKPRHPPPKSALRGIQPNRADGGPRSFPNSSRPSCRCWIYIFGGALYVSLETKRKILEVVKKIGGERMTATSYVEQILRQHLDLYKEEINRIYKERSTKDLL